MTNELIEKYNYDIAISLCQQDIEFAEKLVKALNPGLKIFFYKTNQSELISKSGPEAFANIFKAQSRVVVILSRSEWSNSFYTDIERNAIIDKVKFDGFGFIVIIPMVQDEIPPWYPSTKIYASPFRFSVEELAHFIEFKVSELGGTIKALTVEDRYEHFKSRIDEKKSTVLLQQSPEAIESAKNEIDDFKTFFNTKRKFLTERIGFTTAVYPFGEYQNCSQFRIGRYLLECKLDLPDLFHPLMTTQDVVASFELFEISDSGEPGKSIASEQRVYYYTEKLKGWALRHLFENPTRTERDLLFRNRDHSEFYDLNDILKTSLWVDAWFQKLFHYSTQNIERYL